MKKAFATLSLLASTAFATQVSIYNDSAFVLSATIVSATGRTVGSVDVYPQSTMKWYDNYGQNYALSQTPYTIIFVCKDTGAEYGIANNVPTGGLITAQSASGRKFCPPPPRQKGQPAPQQPKGSGEFQVQEIY